LRGKEKRNERITEKMKKREVSTRRSFLGFPFSASLSVSRSSSFDPKKRNL